MEKLLGLHAVLAATLAYGATPMNKTVKVESFQIVGIAAKTNNALEMTKDGIIPKLWNRFFQENLLEKIPNQASPAIYAVYTDYVSDRNGDYTFLIGFKVSSAENLPPELVVKPIPAGNYDIFTSDKGPSSKVVPAIWKQIWDQETSGKIHRAYRADFELYDQRASNPQNAQVDVYVGTK